MKPRTVLLSFACINALYVNSFVVTAPLRQLNPKPCGSDCEITRSSLASPTVLSAATSPSSPDDAEEEDPAKDDWMSLSNSEVGDLEKLKQQEAHLARLLSSVRREKLSALRSRPLNIGIVGFGRFGQFIARAFVKHGQVVVAASRSDYSEVANEMGVKYVPLSDPAAFLAEEPDVIVFAVSILSFEQTVQDFVPFIKQQIDETKRRPLIVDVLSVMEHPKNVLLDILPKECDILCTHPMFGPDSGKNGWSGLTFVYERTRVDGVILDPDREPRTFHQLSDSDHRAGWTDGDDLFFELGSGAVHNVHEHSEEHVEGMDRMERYLSIWEEEGCRMVPMSCANHDAYAASSQFITHLVGRILGMLDLRPTPIDTKGFESVLKLVENTNADSFELFYGLYKYNENSSLTIRKMQVALDEVVAKLRVEEKNHRSSPPRFKVNGHFGHKKGLFPVDVPFKLLP